MTVIEQQQPAQSSPTQPPPLEPPPPEISPTRVAVLLIVLLGLAVGAWRLSGSDSSAAGTSSDAVPVYAPYVDVTQTPTYPFQLPSANPVAGVYLAFIVSDPSQPCTPSWGGYYTLEAAEQALDLDARTAQLRSQGGNVMISYGGRDNSDLAVGCTEPQKLLAAYQAPVARYHATAIDLDLEGQTLADAAANTRRAQAIAALQRQQATRHSALAVWMTLPVSGAGLTAQGVAAVQSMLAAHVRLAGVNAMAMDFGPGEGAERDMLGTIERSLYAVHAQLQSLWRAARLPSGAASAWGHLGVTVMAGVNDVSGQRFTVADAKGLATFVNGHGIPRVSVWSLNRDGECGGAFAETGVLSNTCSGVIQTPLQFTRIFGALKGTKTARPVGEEALASTAQQSGLDTIDDPASSPYPIWRSSAAYVSGYKVVWEGDIYQASWWTQGTPPGSAGADSPTGPWQPIGPVPAGSHAPKPVLLVTSSPTPWSASTVYHAGERVSFAGLPYQARWYTHGEQPRRELPSDPSAPWQPLFNYPGEPAAAASETEAG